LPLPLPMPVPMPMPMMATTAGGVGLGGGMGGAAQGGGFGGAGDGFPNRRTIVMHQICVRSVVALRRIVYKSYRQYACLAGQTVRNPASLALRINGPSASKCFGPNCIDFGPTTAMYYAYSTIKAPDKGEVGGSSPPRPTIHQYAAILTFPLFGIFL
jgi:hypothetical protein